MTKFTVTIVDPAHLAGITAARESNNASMFPDTKDEDGNVVVDPARLETDEEYVQFVMANAAASYAKQFDTVGAKKAEFLAAIPVGKRSAVEQAIDAVAKG